MQIADLVQYRRQPSNCFQVRQQYQVVVFPRPVLFFVNVADFGAQYKSHRAAAQRGNALIATACQFIGESEQARLGRHQFFQEFRKPTRVSEIAGCNNRNAFQLGRDIQMFQIQISRSGARKS